MTDKQITFGNVEIEEIRKKKAPKCSRRYLDGSKCQNRAIVVIRNSLESELKYCCYSHLKEWEKASIDYNGSNR